MEDIHEWRADTDSSDSVGYVRNIVFSVNSGNG